MAKTLTSGRPWNGHSYDLGRMTLPESWRAYAAYPVAWYLLHRFVLRGRYPRPPAAFGASNPKRAS